MGVFSGPEIVGEDYALTLFNASGTWTPNFTGTVWVLVIAGGGGGGSDMGGGGGAGGFIQDTVFSVTAGTTYTVTVGAGGSGAPAGQGQVAGSNGGNSVFGSLTAIGGGGGASRHDGSGAPAGNGGSGGGASGGAQPPSGGSGGSGGYGGGARGTGTAGQGNDGAWGVWAWYPGGGGGAGSAGSANPGNGGNGRISFIMNWPYYFSGGGGGAGYSGKGGNGGLGGGGGGAVLEGRGDNTSFLPAQDGGFGGINQWAQVPGGNGALLSGGGGGGGSHYNAGNNGGNGGSGIVIIRHLISQGSSIATPGKYGTFYNAAAPIVIDAGDAANRNLNRASVLVVAGGGSGGVDNGGGGGGGGVIQTTVDLIPGTNYTVTVGAGGAARAGASDDGPGNNGGNSVFGSLTAIGGSGGSGWVNTTLPPGSSSYSGGCGAGQSASTGGVNSLGAGTGTAGQGFNGGTAIAAYAGGGGGAGGVGGNASPNRVGEGGRGFRSIISGTMTIYAAGGAGGFDAINGYASNVDAVTENGTTKKLTQTNEDSCGANTGHGGNGSNHNNWTSGGGGSGVVIVRYPGPQRATGGTITSEDRETIHTFTSSGTFTPVNLVSSGIYGATDKSRIIGLSTAQNGVGYTTANGGGFVFDGDNDKIVTSSFTYIPYCVDVWLYNNNTIPGNDSAIGGPSTYQTLFSFSGTAGVNLGGWTGSATNEAVHIWSTTGGNRLTYTNQQVNSGYHNFVFNWNGSNYDIWIDGVKQTSIAGSSGHAVLQTYSSSPIYLASDNNTYEFNGRIYRFALYKERALTDAEIVYNYNSEKSRFPGSAQNNPATSASEILAADPSAPSGLYWIASPGYEPQQIWCDMTNDGGGWMLVASNDARDTTIPGSTSRQSTIYELDRSGALVGSQGISPNGDYIIGSMINTLPFSQVRIWGWGYGSTNSSTSWDSKGTNVKVIFPVTTSGGWQRLTQIVPRASATITGDLSPNASYFILDGIKIDRMINGYNANSNQTTIGAVGVQDPSGDTAAGTYMGHGITEGSYEGWYNGANSVTDSQGYTTWVK